MCFLKAFKKPVLLPLAVTLLTTLTAPSALWAGSAAPNAATGSGAIARRAAAPLSTQQRIKRDRYFARRLGLDFGVPTGARKAAIARMRQMRAAETSSATSGASATPSSANGAGR